MKFEGTMLFILTAQLAEWILIIKLGTWEGDSIVFHVMIKWASQFAPLAVDPSVIFLINFETDVKKYY